MKVNILSSEIIRPANIPAQPDEPYNNSMQDSIELNNIISTSNGNDGNLKATVCFTELKNVFTYEGKSPSPGTDPFQDSGSVYIPSSISSANSDTGRYHQSGIILYGLSLISDCVESSIFKYS